MSERKIMQKVKIAATGLCLLYTVCIVASSKNGRWVYEDRNGDGKEEKYCEKGGTSCVPPEDQKAIPQYLIEKYLKR